MLLLVSIIGTDSAVIGTNKAEKSPSKGTTNSDNKNKIVLTRGLEVKNNGVTVKGGTLNVTINGGEVNIN